MINNISLHNMTPDKNHPCRQCLHFAPFDYDKKSNQYYGMCKYWNFSINDQDGKSCSQIKLGD